MLIRWPRVLSSAGLTGAMLMASPLSWAAGSPLAAASLEGAEVATGHLFNSLLYLPSGLVAAAMALEFFVQWKKNRDVEPGILFLLFGAAGAAVGVAALAYVFSPVGRDDGQLRMFAMWMGVVAAAVSAAFYLKRQARNRRLFSLQPVPQLSGRIMLPRHSGDRGLIIGYRLALAVAFLLTLVGVSEMPLSQARGPSLAEAVRAVSRSINQPAAAEAAVTAEPAAVGAPSAPAPASPEPPTVPAPAPAPSLASLLATPAPTAPPPPAEAAAGSGAGTASVPAPAAPASAAPASAPAEPATVPPESGAMAAATAPAPKPTGASPAPAPAGRAPAAPKAAATTAVAKLPANFFATKIKPLLDAKCVNCHGSSKQKGDLRLDSVAAIKNGAGHPIVVGGDLELSSLYQRLITPDSEDLMPPPDKGGPLPPKIIAMVKAWVLAGADFGEGGPPSGKAAPPAPAARAGGKLEEEKSRSLQPPPADLVTRLTDAGAVIRPMSSNGALLDINLTHLESGPVNLVELSPMAKNVLALDVSRTKLTDGDLEPLAGMTSLVRLDLKRNAITDAGLEHLKGLTELESLNLFDTKVTDAGLAHLSGLKRLQKLFLFNTQVTPAGAAQLRAAIPGLVVNLGE